MATNYGSMPGGVASILALLIVASVPFTLSCHPIYTLEVKKIGDGAGRVVDSLVLSHGYENLDCGTFCRESHVSRKVTLVAQPDSVSVFDEWSGCDSVSAKGCHLRVDRDRVVVAKFDFVTPEE